MSVDRYHLLLLNYDDCAIQMTPEELSILLKSWRNRQETSNTCLKCHKPLVFQHHYVTCCNQFYYRPTDSYPVHFIGIPTKGYTFALRNLIQNLAKQGIRSDQEFLVLPDPIDWQIVSTLVYEKTMKFVRGQPVTKRTTDIAPPEKSHTFYKQIQEAPLNHGSLHRRSGGKFTYYRQIAFGKRVTLGMRGMIVPDASLRPNQIAIPAKIHKMFGVYGKWLIVNRMPTIQPENFIVLKADKLWEHDCFGIPLEIVDQLNADFDGDEANIYLILNIQCQSEAAVLLDPKSNMGSFTLGIKLNPSHDMLVVYYLYFDEIDFLPYKDKKSLRRTFQVIYELYGSETAFNCIDRMRLYYLDKMQNEMVFGITLKDITRLVQLAKESRCYEEFESKVKTETQNCLVIQVLAQAKGSFYHLYQMFGALGIQGNVYIQGSLWEGLTPVEGVIHSFNTYDAMQKSSKIWQPGYGYSKSFYCLQGLIVDYKGRLVDEELVIEDDVLDALYYEDVMTTDSFLELTRREILVEEEEKR